MKGRKRVTFWDALKANKAPYNTENMSTDTPYNYNKATNNAYEIEEVLLLIRERSLFHQPIINPHFTSNN